MNNEFDVKSSEENDCFISRQCIYKIMMKIVFNFRGCFQKVWLGRNIKTMHFSLLLPVNKLQVMQQNRTVNLYSQQ